MLLSRGVTCIVAVLLISGTTSALSPHTAALNTYQADQGYPQKALDTFEQYLRTAYTGIGLEKNGLDFKVFRYAVIGYYSLLRDGSVTRRGILSVIDYRKSCHEKRLYIIDLRQNTLLLHTLVAHGKHTGNMYAEHFSNESSSLQSSLGFFVTGDTYYGEYGYSLYLDGLDIGFNDNARSRALVVHGAHYVSKSFVKRYGRIGWSWGCPAVPEKVHRQIIDTIKGGTCLFQFHDDLSYLRRSVHLNVWRAAFQFMEEKQSMSARPDS